MLIKIWAARGTPADAATLRARSWEVVEDGRWLEGVGIGAVAIVGHFVSEAEHPKEPVHEFRSRDLHVVVDFYLEVQPLKRLAQLLIVQGNLVLARAR